VLPSVDTSTISKATASNQRTTNIWREEGPWLVVALLAVTLPAFRRGWVGVMLAFILLPQVSHAFSWENVWERSDQQAMKALEHNDPKKAATLFEQPEWKGIAQYRAGDYEQAEQAFAEHDMDLQAVTQHLKEKLGVKGKALFQPLRLTLTGESHGPELKDIVQLLGIERIQQRLAQAKNISQA